MDGLTDFLFHSHPLIGLGVVAMLVLTGITVVLWMDRGPT